MEMGAGCSKGPRNGGRELSLGAIVGNRGGPSRHNEPYNVRRLDVPRSWLHTSPSCPRASTLLVLPGARAARGGPVCAVGGFLARDLREDPDARVEVSHRAPPRRARTGDGMSRTTSSAVGGSLGDGWSPKA